MDSSSWFHGYTSDNTAGNNGFMCGYAASCTPEELQYREERRRQQHQQLLISSQIQHHLNEINMHMDMDDEPVLYLPSSINGASMDMQRSMVDDLLPSHHAGSCFTSSSSSRSLRSASLSCSPESSAHVLTAPAATAFCQYPEVSSHVPLAPVVPYDHGQYTNLHVPTPAVHHDTAAMAPELPATGAFKRYVRHLGPRRPPKQGACGQRMFKTAMSVLAKMHMAMRYNSHQYHYQEAAAAAAAALPPLGNQLQHMISERKRREKLNGSFHALKTVLPPGSKKDKTSILIRAREYVNSLKSKVRELEEKNQALESRLARRAGTGVGEEKEYAKADAGEKVEIEITRASASKEEEPRKLCTVKSPCGNMTDVVVRALQCLKDRTGDDVSLVEMSTSGGGGGGGGGGPPRANLTLQLKSTSGVKWEESVKEAVAKVVADALPPSQYAETTARHGDASTATEQL